ncbi:MAG: transcriptional regulator [Acidobacteriota bacterium]
MKPERQDKIFHALAHAARRRILDIVLASPGCNVNSVCEHFEMSRIAVMGHINVLERSGLLVSERRWRDRCLFFNAVPLQLINERWTSKYSALWAAALTDIKHRVEEKEDLPNAS